MIRGMVTLLRRSIRPLAVLLVLGFAAGYVVRQWDQFVLAARTLAPLTLVLAFLGAVGYWLALGFAWGSTQAALGGTLSPWTAIRVWSVSAVARYVPGNIWHFAGRVVLARSAGLDVLTTLTASAYEQVLTVAGALLVAGLFLPLAGGGGGYLLAVLAVPLGLLVFHPRLQRWLLARSARLAGSAPPTPLSILQLARLVPLYVLPHLAAGLALAALGWPSGVDPLAALGAFSFAWAAGFLTLLTPGGLGVREVTLAALLAALSPAPEPAVLAIGHRLVLTMAEFLVALATGASGRLAARVL
jgi:uncharacterized membrane protein YbhN (UPF0104 family)